MDGVDLFNELVSLSGLAEVIAKGTLIRALRDVGAEPSTATAKTYLRALPRLDARLRAYVGEDEARQRLQSIQRFLQNPRRGGV